MKRLFVIAGETSGDTHGAGVFGELRARHPSLEIHGLGGPRLRALAGDSLEDWVADAAVLGAWEVIKHYGFFRRKFHDALRRIESLRPDAVVLIDYPGFNLRLAQKLQRLRPGLKIIYYISPQVWAWHRSRIPKMARWLDLMICLFPFEAPLYSASGLRTEFGGHPLTDYLAAKRTVHPRAPDLVALLPGSREREIAALWPAMLDAADRLRATHPHLRFATAAVNQRLADRLRTLAGPFPVDIGLGNAPDLMQRAAAGLVASGTATLEAAYFGLPHALVYKVAWLTYEIGRRVITVPHLGIVNILAGRTVVREFIQHAATPDAMAAELARLLDDPEATATLRREMADVVATLGSGGAYARSATLIEQALGAA
ncbi:MAG: lipid-A-disaccharide synthase [Verrucomicrobiales bacterium]